MIIRASEIRKGKIGFEGRQNASTDRLYELMKKYAVPATDPIDFLVHYTRSGYGIERGADYQASRIESAFEDLEKFGYCMLPPSSSKTGETVTWYPD